MISANMKGRDDVKCKATVLMEDSVGRKMLRYNGKMAAFILRSPNDPTDGSQRFNDGTSTSPLPCPSWVN